MICAVQRRRGVPLVVWKSLSSFSHRTHCQTVATETRAAKGSQWWRRRRSFSTASSGGASPTTDDDVFSSFASSSSSSSAAANTTTTEGYVWQTLYDEAHEMIMGAFVSYPMTFLLREARAGRLRHSERVLERVQTGMMMEGGTNMKSLLYPRDFLEIIQDNFDHIETHYPFGHPKYGWFSVFQLYQRMEYLAHDGEAGMGFAEFDDKQEDSRLVYGIAINQRQKRITVVFRGTYADSTRDWTRNLQFGQVEVPLPEAAREHLSGAQSFSSSSASDGTRTTTTKLFVHQGIYEYLLHNSERGADYPQERYEEILGHVLTCLQYYPGYRVFVTGHSLGGALGIMLSFFMAVDERIPKPVSCISVGSLLVGDAAFQKAFEHFESLGWIRHLRITNEYDPVPSLPPFDWYKPVGMHLELCKDQGHVIEHHAYSSRRGGSSDNNNSKQDNATNTAAKNSFSALWKSYQASGAWNAGIEKWTEWHLIPEYLRRLEREKPQLINLSLNGCYRDPRYVGDSFRTRL